MNRRETLKALAGLAASSAWAVPAVARQGVTEDTPLPELMKALLPAMGTIPVKVSGLTPGLSLITGPGGNIAALAGADGLVLVDSFVPEGAAGLASAARGLSSGPITLINTHWHFDHAGGNAALAGLGARIVAHENTRKRLSADQFMVDFQIKVPASPPAALPVVAIGDEATLYLNGEEIRLAHVAPAHTDSDIFIHFRKANVLHAGDLFTKGAYPNIDGSSEGWVGGMVAAADRILGVVDASTKIIPGHGPVGDRDDLRAFRDMLAEAQAKVEALIAAGKTVDEAVAARPLAGLDARWARGIFKGTHFTRIVYGGLARHREKKPVAP